jgi:S-DNA-T family DNA segregation ATPase FtsK/SpoIIIE
VTIVVLAWQGRLPAVGQRVFGIALMIVVTSAFAHLLTAASPTAWPEDRGGVLGYAIASWLQRSVNWMAWPILGYAFLVGLIFTAEELVIHVPRLLRQRSERVRATIAEARPGLPGIRGLLQPFQRLLSHLPVRPRPVPATANAGGRATAAPSRAEPRVNPGRPRPAPTEDEEEEDDEALAAEIEDEADEDDEEYEDEEYDEDGDEEDWDEEEEDEAAAAEEPEREEPVAPEPRMVVNVSRPPVMPAAPPPPPKPYPAELGAWELPPISILHEPEYTFTSRQEALVREKARVLENALQEYRIEASVVEIDTGPVITMFELLLAPGIKVSQIASLANDIARALKAPSVRVVAPIPGKNTVGLEVPNIDKEKVRIKELMTVSRTKSQNMSLPLYLGKDASGGALVEDLTKMPHMLIAGTTGSGKSVCINSIIASILMTQRPDIVKLILVDPKMVEMSMFRDVPHLMCPIVTETERAEKILEWATMKMDERYALLAEASVRNIAAYNRLTTEEKHERFQPTTDEERAQIPLHLPYVVIIIDELADMMMMSAKEVELHLSRLAQKSRAVGIHIIVATQRPEAKIVTGLIKSNLPCRIAFRVASRMDSRIVLDQNGAEVLMGQGDMLFLPPGSSKLVRAQGTYLEDAEIKDMIAFLRERGAPEFHPELMQLGKQELSADGPRDELFNQAVEVVLQSRRGSVSLLQRRLTIGYSRASRLIEEMAAAGIVGEYKGSQAREVLLTDEEWQALKEQEATRITASDATVEDDLFDDDI